MPAPLTDEQRFHRYVRPTGFCWEWVGARDVHGYGVTRIAYRAHRAHRWAYEALVGPLPAGVDLDHLCRVRHCVNPDHLEPVTRAQNLRRGSRTLRRALRTTCKNGHDITTPGALVRRGDRHRCLACERARGKRRLK